MCRVPGQLETPHLVLDYWGSLCHQMREARRCTALMALERRRPATLGGLGAEVCRLACTQGMTVASWETELSLLRALQSGATWRGEQARSHRIMARSPRIMAQGTYPYFGGRPWTEAHLLSAGRLPAVGFGRSRTVSSLGLAIIMAGVHAGCKPRAGGAGVPRGSGSSGAAHVPPLRNVSGGTVGAYGSRRGGTFRRGHRPLPLCGTA